MGMKKIKLSLLLLFMAIASMAQQQAPVIKQGSTVGYTLKLHGQQVAFALTVTRLSDSVILDWKVRNTTTGTYVMLPKAVSKANRLSFVQPEPDTKVVLPPDQTFFFISKTAFQNLLQKRSFEYDNTIYDLQNNGEATTMTVDGKTLNLLHVVARNETTQYWILNNPDLPLICRITGNPLEVDMEINSLK